MSKQISRNVKILIASVGLIDLLEGGALTFFPTSLGAMVWPGHVEPYDALLYAAPYLAIALAAVLVLREQEWARIRIVFPPAIFFTAFMLGVVLGGLNTPDGFSLMRLATWLFVATYFAALVGSIVVYWHYEHN